MTRLNARLHLTAFALMGATACSTLPTSPGNATVAVGGRWHYVVAATNTPAMVGTLVLATGNGAAFTGSLDATETDANGRPVPLAGLVSGRAVDATTVSFDVVLGVSRARHHVATIRGDSLTGTWIETVNAANGTSGTFRAGRSAP